jgi:hypothetical protein
MHPEAIQTVQFKGRFWELCQEGHSESSSEIYRVYTQKSQFFARIPDLASVFGFGYLDKTVLTKPFRYTKRYSCSYLKVSEFHLAAFVEFVTVYD